MRDHPHHHSGVDGFGGEPVEAEHNAVGSGASISAGIVVMREGGVGKERRRKGEEGREEGKRGREEGKGGREEGKGGREEGKGGREEREGRREGREGRREREGGKGKARLTAAM